jgi:signal transduction histidine kinase
MRKAVAVAIPALTVTLLVVAAILGRSAEPLLWLPLSLSSATVGALLWDRRSGGAIGPLFVAVGVSIPLGEVASAYASAAPARGLPGGPWAAWFFQSSIALSVLFFLILQVFPTGRPLPRWRWLVGVTIADGVALLLVPALGSTAPFRANFPGLAHPLPVVAPSVSDQAYDLANLVSLILFALSALTIVLRYRRSTGDLRAQMKWFAAAAALAAAGLVIGVVLVPDGPAIVFALLAPTVPIAAGIAILRYRLYDIDVVISKALLLALLATAITVVYVVVVVGVGALTGEGHSEILSIAATVLVAIVFQPIREQAQRLANRLVYGERATPYEVMAGFSSRVADAVSTDDVLPEMAAAVGRGVGAVEATVRVHLPDGTDRVQRWVGDGAPDRAGEPWTIAIAYQGRPVGDLTVRKPLTEPLTPAERHLLEDLGSQAGLALHNVRLTEELAIRLRELDAQAAALRVSRERLVTARDAQRRGLQRDIQEGPERQLIDIGRRLAVVDDPDALDPLIDRANDTLEELRDLARGIFPPLLADQGIQAALEAHIRKIGARATVESGPGVAGRRFDADVEACAYFCCLQALQNVQRHAGNAEAAVRLRLEAGELVFEIEDRGPGFDVDGTPRGMGLQIIQDRVDALDGSLGVTSSPTSTRVVGRVPAVAAEPVGVRT